MLKAITLLKRLFFINVFISFIILSLYFIGFDPSEAIVVLYSPLAILTQAFLLNLLATFLAIVLMYFGVWAMAVPFVFIQLMLFIDYFIFRIYRFHIDFFFIKMFFQDFEGMGASLLVVTSIILGFFVLAVIFAWLAIKFVHSARVPYTGKALLLIFVMSFLGQSIHAWGYAHNYRAILSVSPNIPWYAPLIATPEVKQLGLYNEALKQDQLNLDVEPSGDFLYPKEEFSCPAEQAKNVIFVVLESWRHDRMTPEITPNIYQIGQQSLSFTNHLSGGNVTTNGMFSLFFGTTSIFKQKTESNAVLPALVSSLKSNDYDFHLLANQDIVKNNLSTQLFGDTRLLQANYGGSNGVGDTQLIDKFEQTVSVDKPFFSFIFFNDSHFPYKAPDYFDQPFQPAKMLSLSDVSQDTDPEVYLNQYSNSIHYLDHLVGRLQSILIEKGIWEETIVVITGDHGEGFNDDANGYWGHGSQFDRHQLGVPLVVQWPGKQGQYDYRTAHEDIASSVLIDGLGCQTEFKNVGTGLSLFDSTERRIIAESYVHRAFIQGDNVFEIYPGYVETYDLNGNSIESGSGGELANFMKIQTWFNKE